MGTRRGENRARGTRGMAPPMGRPAGSQPAGFYNPQTAMGMRPVDGGQLVPGKAGKDIAGIAVTAVVSAVITAVLVLLVQGAIQSRAIGEAEALAKEKTEQLERQQTDIDAAKDAVRTANEELKGKIDSFTQTIESQRAEIESLRTRTEEQQSIIDEAKASGLIGEGE